MDIWRVFFFFGGGGGGLLTKNPKNLRCFGGFLGVVFFAILDTLGKLRACHPKIAHLSPSLNFQ